MRDDRSSKMSKGMCPAASNWGYNIHRVIISVACQELEDGEATLSINRAK